MWEFKQKQKRKRAQQIALSVPVLAGLVIITGFMVVAVWNIYVKARDTQLKLDKTTSAYEELHLRELELTASTEGMKTSFGVESEIRDKYGLVREGEEVVVIIDDKNKEDENDSKAGESWWQKIKDLF